MRTVMFVWQRYTPPFLIGGAEVSQKLLAEELTRLGWRVVYIGSHDPPWGKTSQLKDIKRALDGWAVPYSSDGDNLQYCWNGIECYSVRQSEVSRTLDGFLNRITCDLVVTAQEESAQLARRARSAAPVVGWIHSISKTGMEVLKGQPHYALATSRFVLAQIPDLAETKALLFYPPFIQPVGESTTMSYYVDDLLMVNPVPEKGSELVKRLAKACPECQFTLVEGWSDTRNEFLGLPNVRYVVRTYDMNALYRSHRVLLVPSVVQDAFPRVIIEAALNARPAIGSDRGGIPEAIMDGGIVLPHDDLAAWVSAIKSLDDRKIADYAERAHTRSMQFVRSCVAELMEVGVISSI